MRRDARSLLDRLNRSDFDYHDFTDAVEEIEMWPLFQALLRDPRILSASLSNRAPDVQPAIPAHHRAPAPTLTREPNGAKPVIEQQREPNLREFLSLLGGERA